MSFWYNTSRISRPNHHPRRSSPERSKSQNILSKVRFPKFKKQVQKYIGFVNYYQNYIPRLSEKLIGMYELLKANSKIRISKTLSTTSKKQRQPSGSLRSCTQTTHSRKTIRPNDGRKFPNIGLHPNDRRK